MAEIAHCAFKNELSAGIKIKLPESFIFSFLLHMLTRTY